MSELQKGQLDRDSLPWLVSCHNHRQRMRMLGDPVEQTQTLAGTRAADKFHPERKPATTCTLTLKEIIEQPQRVATSVKEILDECVSVIDPTRSVFHNMKYKEGKNPSPAEKLANELVKKVGREKLIEFIRERDAIYREIRDETRESWIDDHVSRNWALGNEETGVSKEARAEEAALFYICQNNVVKNSNTLEHRILRNDSEIFHLPVSLLVSDKSKMVSIFFNAINVNHINFISELHKDSKTSIHTEDAWDLLDIHRGLYKKSDLIMLSGHFSNNYLPEEHFFEKINEHIIPACHEGANVIIINSFSEPKEAFFRKNGFKTEIVRRNEDIGAFSTHYLLAYRVNEAFINNL